MHATGACIAGAGECELAPFAFLPDLAPVQAQTS